MIHLTDMQKIEFVSECPSCGGLNIREGHLGQSGDWVNFIPLGLKKIALTFKPNGVKIENKSRMCEDCGFIWTQADPVKLKKTLDAWKK